MHNEIKGINSIQNQIARSMWIIDDKYWLLQANQPLTSFLKKQYPKGAEDERRRPDFICVSNEYTLVIVEIKRPSHEMTMDDIVQIRSIDRTILNVPLEGVYTVEVGGVEEKHLEVCCDAGSFEFKGFNNERIYRIAEGLQALCDDARQVEREALFRSIETLSRVRALVCGFFPSRFGQTLSPAARAGSSAAM